MISELLDGNAAFGKNEFNTHLEHYQRIAHQQSPQVLWIGCSDSRVSEDVVTGSKPGTIFVHRNIANIVAFNDVNVAAIVEYAVAHLKIPDIVVRAHEVWRHRGDRARGQGELHRRLAADRHRRQGQGRSPRVGAEPDARRSWTC